MEALLRTFSAQKIISYCSARLMTLPGRGVVAYALLYEFIMETILVDPAGETIADPPRAQGVTTRPLPTTVTPPLDTTKPRARSCSLSTPTMAPSITTTFLSKIVFSTTA